MTQVTSNSIPVFPTPCAFRKKWGILLFAFVGLYLLSAVGSLVIQHWLEDTYRRSATESRAWADRYKRYVKIGQQALLMNTSRLEALKASNIEAGWKRAREAQRAFEEQLLNDRTEIKTNVTGAEALQLEKDFDVLKTSIDDMALEMGTLFSRFHRNQQPEVSQQMSAVDRRYRNVLRAFSLLRDHVAHEQRNHQEKEIFAARALEKVQYIIDGLLLVMIIALAMFGHRLTRRMIASVREKQNLLAQIRETEGKYLSIINNAVEGIFQSTPEGRYLTANMALAKMHGYESPDELISSITDIGRQIYVNPASREEILSCLEKNDALTGFEVEIYRKDGRTIWISLNVHAVRDQNGKIVYIEGTAVDITERLWAEQRRDLQYLTRQAFAEATTITEARLKILKTICEILDWEMGAIWNVEQQADALQCSEIWHHAMIDIEEFEAVTEGVSFVKGRGLVGKVWESGDPAWLPDPSQWDDSPIMIVAARMGMQSAFCMPIKSGSEVLHVLEFFSPKKTLPDPELLQTLATISNQLGQMIDHKRGEEALRESEARKSGILESALECIIAFDSEGRITEFNPAAEHTFGHLRANVLGREMVGVLFPKRMLRESQLRAPALALYHEIASRSTVGQQIELTAIRADGREFPVEMSISRIEVNGVAMFTTCLRDITERKRFEEQLLQSQKMEAVGRLAAGVAHDFNNILTTILGYSDLLLAKMEASHPMHKNLTEIRHAGEFAASLTQQLLTFSRRQSLQLEILDVNEVVSGMEQMLKQLTGKEVHVMTVLDKEVKKIKADPRQLEQVLLNLAVNARDAMPGGGVITIQTSNVKFLEADLHHTHKLPPGEYVRLMISDTGSGMTDEVKKHLFEPFYTTKAQGKGTGLGLATCYGIIKQCSGHILVESIVGQGTTFRIYFPCAGVDAGESAGKSDKKELPRGSETVLIVEDEIAIRSLAVHILRKLGYKVLEAEDAESAREVVKSQRERIDLLLADIMLPNSGGGREIAGWLVGLHKETKVLFTSGYMDESVLRQHGVEPGTTFLQKPYTPADLAQRVREALES